MTSALIIGCAVVAAIAIIEIPVLLRSIKLLLVRANETLQDIEGDLDAIRDELCDMRKDQM